MFNNMNDMPLPFMGMPMMFPFMQGVNNTTDTNAQQANGFPFLNCTMPQMQQMMFPLFMQGMQGMNNPSDTANGQQANGFPFPFGMMPQMMFPFFMQGMQGMNNPTDTMNGQQANGFPFPFGMIPQMMFPFFMQGMKNNECKEDTSAQEGFPFMGMTIPKSMLQKLLNMNWAPEELDKLQKVIDMIYALMPKK